MPGLRPREVVPIIAAIVGAAAAGAYARVPRDEQVPSGSHGLWSDDRDRARRAGSLMTTGSGAALGLLTVGRHGCLFYRGNAFTRSLTRAYTTGPLPSTARWRSSSDSVWSMRWKYVSLKFGG